MCSSADDVYFSVSRNKCISCPRPCTGCMDTSSGLSRASMANPYVENSWVTADYCRGCLPGYAFDDASANGCSECPAGSSSNPSARTCDLCPPGSYSGSPRTSGSCTRCPFGFYCPLGATATIPCDVGIYCPEGSSSRFGASYATTPTGSPTASVSATATSSASATASAPNSATPAPSLSATASAPRSASPLPSRSAHPTLSASATATASATGTATLIWRQPTCDPKASIIQLSMDDAMKGPLISFCIETDCIATRRLDHEDKSAASRRLRSANGRALAAAASPSPTPSFNPCDPSQTYASNGVAPPSSDRDASFLPFIPSPTATPDPSLPIIATNITADSVAQMALVGLPLPASADDQALLAGSIARAASTFTGLSVSATLELAADGASTLATLTATVAVVYISEPIADLANFTMTVNDTIGLSDTIARVQQSAEIGQNKLITFATGSSVGGQTPPFVSCANASASALASVEYQGLCFGPQAPAFNDSDVSPDAFSANFTPAGYRQRRRRRLQGGGAPSFMSLLAITAKLAGAPPVDAASIAVAASPPITSTSLQAIVLPGQAVAGATPTATAQPSPTPSPSHTPAAPLPLPAGGFLGGNLTSFIKRLEMKAASSDALKLAVAIGAGVGGALVALVLGALGVMARARWLAHRASLAGNAGGSGGGKMSARVAPAEAAAK